MIHVVKMLRNGWLGAIRLFALLAMASVAFPATAETEQNEKQGCNPVYVQMGETVLGIGVRDFLVAYHLDGKTVSLQERCKSSIQKPIETSEVLFLAKLYFDHRPHPVRLKYILSNESVYIKTFRPYETVLHELIDQERSIKELSTIGPFYTNDDLFGLKTFIAKEKKLFGYNNHPLTLFLCGPKHTPLACSIVYRWKRNIYVRAVKNDFIVKESGDPTFENWIELFPKYLSVVESKLIPSQGE